MRKGGRASAGTGALDRLSSSHVQQNGVSRTLVWRKQGYTARPDARALHPAALGRLALTGLFLLIQI
jgi:hypothetical protein